MFDYSKSQTIGAGKMALLKCEGPCTLTWFGESQCAKTCAGHAAIITSFESVMEGIARSMQKKASQSITEVKPHVYTSSELQGRFDTPVPWAADEIDTSYPHAESWKTLQVEDAQLKRLGGKSEL